MLLSEEPISSQQLGVQNDFKPIQFEDLEELLYAYRHGMISEQDDKKGFIND